jgi:hypothetical protein
MASNSCVSFAMGHGAIRRHDSDMRKRLPKEYAFALEEEEALEQSIAEVERGECVTADQLFVELRAIRLRSDAAVTQPQAPTKSQS